MNTWWGIPSLAVQISRFSSKMPLRCYYPCKPMWRHKRKAWRTTEQWTKLTPRQHRYGCVSNSFSASQEIHHILWYSKGLYHVHKSLPIAPHPFSSFSTYSAKPFSLALASLIIDAHSSLFNAFILHRFTPSFLKLSSTSFIHLSLGHAVPLLASNFPSKIFTTDSWSHSFYLHV